MEIKKFIVSLKTFGHQFDQVAKEHFRDESNGYMFAIKSIAPVDTGALKEDWKKETVNESAGELSISFSNSKPYSIDIELGSVPGKQPWPRVGQKTVFFDGRIYSSQAPFGTVEKVFNESNMHKLSKEILNRIFQVWRAI
jgi:hypothetical protein